MNCVDLARTLVRFPSLNPPGEEKACADYVANLLEQAGLKVELHEFAPGRPSMVARLRGASDLSPLAFTGHLDVVPLGEKPWSAPPFTFVGNFRETAVAQGFLITDASRRSNIVLDPFVGSGSRARFLRRPGST
jgi:hypothetical protein